MPPTRTPRTTRQEPLSTHIRNRLVQRARLHRLARQRNKAELLRRLTGLADTSYASGDVEVEEMVLDEAEESVLEEDSTGDTVSTRDVAMRERSDSMVFERGQSVWVTVGTTETVGDGGEGMVVDREGGREEEQGVGVGVGMSVEAERTDAMDIFERMEDCDRDSGVAPPGKNVDGNKDEEDVSMGLENLRLQP